MQFQRSLTTTCSKMPMNSWTFLSITLVKLLLVIVDLYCNFYKVLSLFSILSAERQNNNGTLLSSGSSKGRGGPRDSINNTMGSLNLNGCNGSTTSNPTNEPTWVHEIFQGILTSETRCLNCETVMEISI